MLENIVHKNVHFIGIGGVSMSALALIMLDNGANVSGSDRAESVETKELEEKGAEIFYGQKSSNIKNPDIVVYTAAISEENEELIEARKKCSIVLERADFLGELMKEYEMPVAICGTHGKTTTTSMISSVFLEANTNPTILVGGTLDKIGGNLNIGTKKHMIFEACEYVDSFLKFNPFAEVVLNVDKDHLDYFSGIEQIKDSFTKFLNKIPNNGFAVINADDDNTVECVNRLNNKKIITYGEKGDYNPRNISYKDNGCAEFDVYFKDEKRGHISLNVPGEHNISNALATYALSEAFNIPSVAIENGIEGFTGACRRFEFKGNFNGATLIDDYAHHPTEIEATLKAAKNKKHNKIICVFQPHTYTRTIKLLDDFAKALSHADEVIITDIYAAREKNTVGVTPNMLAEKINGAKYIGPFDEIAKYLKENVKENDIVISMGAGTITKLSDYLL